MKSNFKITMAALLGTVVEYYDYSLYGFSSKSIAQAFFPSSDETLAMVITLGVFAVGYLSKPLGAVIFGHIGDKFGRKTSLNATIIGIALPTVLIGLMPSYESIGIFAPIIVILCRFLQGVFVGGEYDGAAIFLLEHNGRLKSGYSSAIVRASGVLGLLVGALVITISTSWLGESWRVPFILSLPLMLLTLYFRQFITETPEFSKYVDKAETKRLQAKEDRAGLFEILQMHWKAMLGIALFFGSLSGCLQLLLVFLKSFLPLVSQLPERWGQVVHIATIVATGISMLATAFLADKYNKQRIMIGCYTMSFAFIGLLAYGIHSQSLALIIAAQLLLGFSLAPPSALMHGYVYQTFGVAHRYRAISISHNIGSMALSGSAPFLAMSLYRFFESPLTPIFYFLLLLLASAVITTRVGSGQGHAQ